VRPILIALTLSGLLQAATDAPVLAEREILVLTVMQQQIEIAQLRLQRAVADLKKPGWRVDLVEGQWRYVPAPPEGAPP
jgi:hypothetical protein